MIKDHVRLDAAQRGITRLCHFTSFANLIAILSDKSGLLSTRKLKDLKDQTFLPTDQLRLDGHLEYISCSIEYVNVWYLHKVQKLQVIFPELVVILIDPKHLWRHDSKYCYRNSAANGGLFVGATDADFDKMFAPEVVGAYGHTYRRTSHQLDCVPTDDQAEVLVKDSIPMEDFIGIAVQNEAQAMDLVSGLDLLSISLEGIPIIVSPALFSRGLRSIVSAGRRPPEVLFRSGYGEIVGND